MQEIYEMPELAFLELCFLKYEMHYISLQLHMYRDGYFKKLIFRDYFHKNKLLKIKHYTIRFKYAINCLNVQKVQIPKEPIIYIAK